jgi:ATP-dependent Clp protease ATP-binding subunit ClpC
MGEQLPTNLELRTLILVRELFDGSELCLPVASPELVSFGDDGAGLTEQRLFLEEYLPDQPPEVLARFSCPAETELVELDVELPRWDLPDRLQLKTSITVGCVVFPHGRDRWVLVPAVGHTFHCGPSEDLKQALADEVRRMVTASEPTPLEYLAVLPPREHRLEELLLTIDRSALLVPGRGRERRRAIAERKQRADALKILESVSVPLHDSDDVQNGPPLVGRQHELELLEGLLGGTHRQSALLVGTDLVGKTALFHGWLRRRREAGRTVQAFATSGAQLIAGMSGLGQWQERVRRVMEAAERLDAVLYFDNLGDLLSDHAGSGVDIAGTMRPYLDDGRVRICGELRPESLDFFESRQPGFIAVLQRVRVEPMTVEQAREVLEARVAHAARHAPHRPNLAPEALQPLLDLVDRYQPYQPHPGKAVKLLEELRAASEGSPDRAPAIGERQLLELFSLQTGIPLFLLRQDLPLKLADLIGAFSKQLVGQDEAVRRVAETICVVKARLQPPGKPLATFLFIGPTGVGKTELARRLAAYLFGSDERLLRFDMSEFMDAAAAQRLIRGTDRDEGLLTRRVRQQPFCVLLLDEIEKAHPAVFDLLLQVCGEGRLTDAGGRTAYFSNAIIVMTSNLGVAARRDAIGLRGGATDDDAYYRDQVNRAFRPEFVNRIDRVIVFSSLTPSQIAQVARLGLLRLTGRRGLTEIGVELQVEEPALAELAWQGYSPQYGARHLRRHLEDNVVAPLARLLAGLGAAARGARAHLRPAATPRTEEPLAEAICGDLRLQVVRGGAGSPRHQQRFAQQAPDISTLRRTAALHLQLPTVAEVKERLDVIVTQLSARRPKTEGRDRRLAHDVGALQTEHHRLQPLWQRATQHHADLEGIEELALGALFAEEDAAPFVRESEETFDRFLEVLYYLFLAGRAHRDDVTLLVQELDDGRALDLWLRPLLAALERRRWQLTAHVDGGQRVSGDVWPSERRWGPPRGVDWLQQQLALEQRPFRNLMLRCSGPYAGALALEGGLHHYGTSASETLMVVFHVAQRTTFTDAEWLDPRLRPRTPAVFPELKRLAPVRCYERPSGPCLVLGRARSADVPLADYWARYEQIGIQHMLACELDKRAVLDDAFTSLLAKVAP